MVNRVVAVLGALLVSGTLQAQIVDDPRLPNARWGMSLGYNRTPVLGIALTGFAANELRPAGLPLRGTVALDVLVSENEDSPYYRTSAYDGIDGWPVKAGRSSWFGQLSAGDQFTQVDAGIVVRF